MVHFIYYLMHNLPRFRSLKIFPIRVHSYMESDYQMALVKMDVELPNDWRREFTGVKKIRHPKQVINITKFVFFA